MKAIYLLTLVISALSISNRSKAEDYQLPYSVSFAESVFAGGMNHFLKNVFSNPLYAQDFFPNNLFHIIELLQYGTKTGKDKKYVKSIFYLFSNKMKACSYINAYSFSGMLPQMSILLEPYMAIETSRSVESLKDIIFEMQYHTFKTQFPEFKLNPDSFLTNLSQEIADAAELRKVITVFLEISLNKLIWSPEDQFESWQNTKIIADYLVELYRKNMLMTIEDLDSLFITLLERYCFFLDIAGTHLEVATYEKIKDDIHNNYTPLLDLEEQEQYIESKMQRFMRCLIEQEAKARAKELGIVI